MSEYDELWEFLHNCDFQWECVADDSPFDNVLGRRHSVRVVRIVFEVQDGDDDE